MERLSISIWCNFNTARDPWKDISTIKLSFYVLIVSQHTILMYAYGHMQQWYSCGDAVVSFFYILNIQVAFKISNIFVHEICQVSSELRPYFY